MSEEEFMQGVTQAARVERIDVDAESYEEVRNAAIEWIETEMIRSGRRQWSWTTEYLVDTRQYRIQFITRQAEPTRHPQEP